MKKPINIYFATFALILYLLGPGVVPVIRHYSPVS